MCYTFGQQGAPAQLWGLRSALSPSQEEAAAAAAAIGIAAPVTQGGPGASPGSGCVLSGESAARMTQGLPPLEKVGQHSFSIVAKCMQAILQDLAVAAECMGCPAAAAVCTRVCLCSHALGLHNTGIWRGSCALSSARSELMCAQRRAGRDAGGGKYFP